MTSRPPGKQGNPLAGCGVIAVFLIGAVVYCAPDSKETTQATEGAGAFVVPEGFDHGAPVSRAMFGAAWPLTVDSGAVLTKGPAYVFRADDGTLYALNGTAMTAAKHFGWEKEIEPIWRDAPNGPGPKVNIGDLIACGSNLEEGKPCTAPR